MFYKKSTEGRNPSTQKVYKRTPKIIETEKVSSKELKVWQHVPPLLENNDPTKILQ
jgi:hypothetical protein